MEFYEVIEQRRSTRTFTDQPIEAEKLHQILRAANLAPSAGNLQAYEIYVVRDLKLKQALAHASHDQEFLIQAPVVLVFCEHPGRTRPRYGQRGVDLYAVQDATIACTHAMLAARSLGLGSVWVGAFHDDGIYKTIGSPPDQQPIAMLPLGYPAEWPAPRSRRPLSDLVHDLG